MSISARPSSDERLSEIEKISTTVFDSSAFDSYMGELLDLVRRLLRSDTATILLLDSVTNELVATAAKGIEEEVRLNVRVTWGTGFAGRVAATRRPVVLDHVDETNTVNPLLAGRGLVAMVGVPVMVGGTVLGVLHAGSVTPRAFDASDVEVMQAIADRAAVVVQSRMLGSERSTARALARSLVPARLPVVPGVALAARYIPGEQGGVGGDWYDVFVSPTGKLCVAVGDVVGHGLRAAVVMGRLRSALRAYALERDDPAAVLEALDRKIQHFEPGAMATVVYAVFDPGLDRAQVSLAGHFAPILARRDEPAQLATLQVDPPLGVVPDRVRRSGSVDFPPGAVLAFYTDGLIERRDSSIDADLDRLCRVITPRPPDSVCASVVSELIGEETNDDDVALLVLRRVP